MTEPKNITESDIIVAGGGPAGMIFSLMTASRGIRTLVLEQHHNFDREYRGEVLMPRFIQTMKQVGLFGLIETCPHLKLNGFEFYLHGRRIANIRIDEISKKVPYILWVPQTVLLNALYEKARRLKTFDILFNARADGLLEENGKICGVEAIVEGKKVPIRSRLVVGADGRASAMRTQGGFEFEYQDHDFDILWFTIPKPAGYEDKVRAFVTAKHNCLALPKLPHYLQCGLLLRVGEYAEYRRKGIEFLKKDIHDTHPLFEEFAGSLKSFAPFSLLAAKAERVKSWARDGLVLIGDAAHTCSPAGAIGVSMAAETAVVAADIVAENFRLGDLSKAVLDKIQDVRLGEIKEIQSIQRRAAGVVGTFSPIGRIWTALFMLMAANTGIFRQIQKKLMVLEKPLPISGEWEKHIHIACRTPSQGDMLTKGR